MPSAKCHICNSRKNVITGKTEHNIEFGNNILPGMPPQAKWSLCECCIKKGWRIINAFNGFLHYLLRQRKSVRIK